MTSEGQPHRRYDPLRDKWVLVSPHRNQRPWDGQQEEPAPAEPAYRNDCYLCPGNARVGGTRNPDYAGVHVFDNDFPALLPDGGSDTIDDPLLRQRAVSGRCRVICYSPEHNLTMASMELPALRRVVDTWAQEVAALSEEYRWVQVFENRGAAMGCSNMHPHGQIWALDTVPSEADVEDRQQRDYFDNHGCALLIDYAEREIALGERLVCSNPHWVALVPWWAVWPFEVLLLPRFPVAHLPQLNPEQRSSLAQILRKFLDAYDRLFATPFPYSMGWHGAPGAKASPHWQLHAHFYPPLLRSASVRKHMVGFEMLGESQRDLTAETAAERLRSVLRDSPLN